MPAHNPAPIEVAVPEEVSHPWHPEPPIEDGVFAIPFLRPPGPSDAVVRLFKVLIVAMGFVAEVFLISTFALTGEAGIACGVGAVVVFLLVLSVVARGRRCLQPARSAPPPAPEFVALIAQ